MKSALHENSKKWTAEEKAQAARLWNSGASAAQIATRFCVQRNSIIGLVNRNRDIFIRRSGKASARPPVEPRPTTAKKVKRAAPATEPKLRGKAPSLVIVDEFCPAPPRAPKQPEPDEKPVYIKPSALAASLGVPMRSGAKPTRAYAHAGTVPIPVAFSDLEPSQCRWPINDFEDRSGADMPCCGATIVPGRSYCQGHINLAYKVIRRA